jgi:hypothetical protein
MLYLVEHQVDPARQHFFLESSFDEGIGNLQTEIFMK